MPTRLSTRDADFAERFGAFLETKRESAEDVEAVVRSIIADVVSRGDRALIELTEKFDGVELTAATMRIPESDFDLALAAIDPRTRDALQFARDRIETHHRRQLPKDESYVDPIGVELGHRWTPVEAVGLYVPGGTAAYPSSLLMNVIPAKVAGVTRLAITVPTPGGTINPMVLAAAKLAGATEIYRVGGAQAIAALAFGTETIAPVAKIVGPGNAYVAAAKRIVFGQVGIDMVAGPSEVLVLADGSADPDFIAADLLAQAEHDAVAQPILVTNEAKLVDAVERSIARQLQSLPRADIAGASWRDFGAMILVERLEDAIPLIDRLAPEHVELMGAEAEKLSGRIRNAGAIFIGAFTPEAIGDYVGGSNHVLPTGRAARYASGLSVLDFMKRTSILKCGPEQLKQLGPSAIVLGEAEGLEAHARSVRARLDRS
jgi:histidinol dehydrogenase